jgi:hypothetical protein
MLSPARFSVWASAASPDSADSGRFALHSGNESWLGAFTYKSLTGKTIDLA